MGETVTAVHVAYRQASGWELVPASLWNNPPRGACRARLKPMLETGDEIRVLCGRPALELNRWGEPQIVDRAKRWLLDAGYARLEKGHGLVIDEDAVRAAINQDAVSVENRTLER